MCEIPYLYPQNLTHAAPTSDYTYQTLLNADDENIENGEVKPVVIVQNLQKKYVTKKKKKKEEITKARVLKCVKK